MEREVSALIETSTAYGLPNIFRSKRLFNKLFWLAFLLASVTAAVYYIVNDVVDFYNYEVVTSVKTEYDQPTEFPTISFCGLQPTDYFGRGISGIFSSDEGVLNDPNNHYEQFISPLCGKCGKCYRFNSGKNMTNYSIPIKNSNFGGFYDFYDLSIFAPNGLLVWIHNKSSITNIERNHILVSADTKSYIAVERTFESKVEEPYNNCLKDVSKFKKNETLINYFLNRNLSYSQENCLDLCFDLFYIKENPCNCKQAELGNVFEKCWIIKEKGKYLSCTWKYRINFTKYDLVEKCSDFCPLECESMTFSYSILTYNSLNTTNSQSTSIYVYYKTLKYTSITQQVKTKPEQLISNLGGYLGLFVGLSFVSLFEITEIIIEIIFILSGKRNVIQPKIQLNEIALRPEIEMIKMELDMFKIELVNKTELESKLAIHNKENKEKLMELSGLIEIIQKKLK